MVNMCINVKQTTVYTHVNGDRHSHIENSKIKKLKRGARTGGTYYIPNAHRNICIKSLNMQ